MKRYQIQLPEDIYATAVRLAASRLTSASTVLRGWILIGMQKDGVGIPGGSNMPAKNLITNTHQKPQTAAYEPPVVIPEMFKRKPQNTVEHHQFSKGEVPPDD